MKSECLALAVSVLVTGSLSAAVTSLGSYLKSTDGDETFTDVFGSGTQLFNFTSGNVYVVYDITFRNPTSTILDTTQSYGGYSHSSGDLFGQLWEQSTVGVLYYGARNDVAGVTIVPEAPLKMVVKYELNGAGLDGDTVKFWVNPALGTGSETAADDADPIRTWGPAAISSDQMRFRRGNSSENEITFSNVTIFDGGDSPFAVIPEPSSALLMGLAGLGLMARRRN